MQIKKKIWIATLFPEYFDAFFAAGVCSRAKEFFDVEIINIRDFSLNKYRSVDDTPYGGGPGMVMRADVCFEALKHKVLEPLGYDSQQWTAQTYQEPHMVFVSPRGEKWSSLQAKGLAEHLTSSDTTQNIVFWCGRYEGIDERFIQRFIHKIYSTSL